MYNLYINTTESENKGTFSIAYTHKPLYFEPGSKIAFNNALIYNAINNISASRANNVIYILVETSNNDVSDKLPTVTASASSEHSGFFKTTRAKTSTTLEDVPSYDDVFGKTIGTQKLFKMILPMGNIV